jgi:hypothetical protein
MSIVIGVWFGLAGGLAALVGVIGLCRIRRLRARGVKAWAAATPYDAEGGRSRLVSLRYELADGRVLERIRSLPARKAVALRPGQKVLIWYDPAEPEDILVYGRREGLADATFIVVGALLVLAATGLGAFGG